MNATTYAEPRPRPDLWTALVTQSRVIGALLLRELHTRYGRENVGYLWMIGEPMILATVIGGLHMAGSHNFYTGDLRPLPFVVSGYTMFILFRGIVNRSEGGVEANAPLLYHRMVTVFDIVMARALLEFAGIFLTFFVLFTLLVCVGWASLPARPLMLIAAWGLMWWYCVGQSLIISAITYENRTVGRLIHPYSYFMTGLSGAFFQMAWIPHPYRDYLLWVPMTDIFELMRHGMFRSANLDFFFPVYTIGACLVLTWIGLVCVKNMRDKIHV